MSEKKPPYHGTRLRSLRIDDPLWSDAVKITARRGESVSEVVRKALERYVKRYAE